MGIEDNRREAFEAHVRKTSQIDIDADGEDYVFQRNAVGYCRAWMAKEWRDWNAALDSVVIELPAPPAIDAGRNSYTRTQSAYHQGMLAVIEAVESAGLKVKS